MSESRFVIDRHGNRIAVEEHPTIDALLVDLDRDQLQQLVAGLVEREPALADVVERQVALLRAAQPALVAAAEPRQPRTPVDTAAFRGQVRAFFRGAGRGRGGVAYREERTILDGVQGVLGQAEAVIQAGDGRSAMAILEAMTEEYIADWTLLDGSSGESGEFFGTLGEAWTEALLSADLSPDERESWRLKLETWSVEIAEYGIEEAFDAALGALEYGWDYPPLQRVLAGEITELGAWEVEAPRYADELAVARLNVLERQGRFEEYLHLAEAESRLEQLITMLVRLGRIDEATERGLTELGDTHQARALVEALREQGELEQALRIAEHGLMLEGPKGALADSALDLAAGLGQDERTLKFATVAFGENPSLNTYLRARELAGEGWPGLRDELLAQLRSGGRYYGTGPVDVLLHEGLIDDAIAVVKGSSSYDVIRKVADAAIASRPDWVIGTCRQQAESIMDASASKQYEHAAEWLAKAREAYCASGREANWRAYLEGQLQRHTRKRTLRPLLEALRR